MSGLDDLYKEVILDHYRNPRNAGELPSPPARRAEGVNPLCGDQITLTVDVNDNVITDLKIASTGCSISQSSASLMTQAVKGKTIPEADALMAEFKQMLGVEVEDGSDLSSNSEPDIRKLGDLVALHGVVQFPVRIKCATLGWNTLHEALANSGEVATTE